MQNIQHQVSTLWPPPRAQNPPSVESGNYLLPPSQGQREVQLSRT